MNKKYCLCDNMILLNIYNNILLFKQDFIAILVVISIFAFIGVLRSKIEKCELMLLLCINKLNVFDLQNKFSMLFQYFLLLSIEHVPMASFELGCRFINYVSALFVVKLLRKHAVFSPVCSTRATQNGTYFQQQCFFTFCYQIIRCAKKLCRHENVFRYIKK